MAVSRRRFLEVAACAASGALISAAPALGGGASAASIPSGRSQPDLPCALLDLEADCVLSESHAGFQNSLGANSIAFERVTVGAIRPARVVLIPGGVLRSARTAQAIRERVDAGAAVVYESGAAYADAGDFASEQRLLAQYFGLETGEPVDLWHAGEQSFGSVAFAPYVRYDWPAQAMVRDFSRAIPVLGAHTFARLGNIRAAARVKLGAGEFIFLGSPLGPHLNARDPEALTLLKAFVA